MERMIKRIAIRKDGTISMSEFRNFAEKYQGEIDKLEEENRKLKLENAKLKDRIITDENFEEKLDKENKNLKEKVETLELWLDNKEKVNKSLREENEKLKKYYDRDKEELMESCYSLARENDKLKSDLAYERTMLDNVRAEYESLQNVNKKLKEENENLEEINQKLLRDLDTVEEIKDRERISLRERIEKLEQELKEERVKNKILRMRK